MATNTGHHLTHVSLFTQIYIAVATIYPGWPPLKALFRQRLTLVDSGAIPESNTTDIGAACQLHQATQAMGSMRCGIFVIQVQFFVYTLLFSHHFCCLLAQL